MGRGRFSLKGNPHEPLEPHRSPPCPVGPPSQCTRCPGTPQHDHRKSRSHGHGDRPAHRRSRGAQAARRGTRRRTHGETHLVKERRRTSSRSTSRVGPKEAQAPGRPMPPAPSLSGPQGDDRRRTGSRSCVPVMTKVRTRNKRWPGSCPRPPSPGAAARRWHRAAGRAGRCPARSLPCASRRHRRRQPSTIRRSSPAPRRPLRRRTGPSSAPSGAQPLRRTPPCIRRTPRPQSLVSARAAHSSPT